MCKPLARIVPLDVVRTDETDSGEGESYADESISGSWLGVAEAAVVDTLHAVLTRTSVHRASLVYAAAEELSPMSEHVWNRTYPWPGDTPPARWLYSCCQMLRPLVGTGTDSGPEADVELLPRARALAVLLAAPTQACLALGLSSLLKMLWSWYVKYLPVKAQADMEAHALVAATTLPRFDCDVENQRGTGPLELAEAAAKTLVTLHDDATVMPRDRLPELLELLIARGMRWAFAQSHAAIWQERGMWVDAALTPLLDLCDEKTCEKVRHALVQLRSSVAQPPKHEDFDIALEKRLTVYAATR